MSEFKDKVVLITGGGVGIGRATALAFAGQGAKVVIGNRNIERGREAAQAIREAGGEASFQQTDVRVAAEVEALVAHAVATYGQLDFAFNNAGTFSELRPITETDEDAYDTVVDTNVKGVWLSLKYELRQMLKQGHGAIVNNASVAGVRGSHTGLATYAASKHAVVGLTRCAALENARKGIRVNAVGPAVIETYMGSSFADALGISMEQFGDLHPVGRVGQADEVAGAVLWLCSQQASFVTGTTLMIDGGYTAS